MKDSKKKWKQVGKLFFPVLMLVVLGFSPQQKKLNLTGTVWKYYSNGEYNGYTIQFGEDGKLQSTHPLDVTDGNDAWVQQGKKVHFWFNDHYSDYKGKIIHSGLIRGKAINVSKREWVWELRRESTNKKENANKDLI